MSNEQQNDHDKKLVNITINGTDDQQPKGEYTFDQIVAIAKNLLPDLASGPNILYTITYRKAEGSKHEGALVQGELLQLRWTVSYATATAPARSKPIGLQLPSVECRRIGL